MADGAAAAGAADRSLDPKVLDRLSGLELVARTIVEGFLAGSHRSPHTGSTVSMSLEMSSRTSTGRSSRALTASS